MSSLSQPHLLPQKQKNKTIKKLNKHFWNFAQSQGFLWFQPLLAPPALEGKNSSPGVSDAPGMQHCSLSLSQFPSHLFSFRVKRKLRSGSSVSRAAAPAQPYSLELGSSIFLSAPSCPTFSLQCMIYILCSPSEDFPRFSLCSLDHMGSITSMCTFGLGFLKILFPIPSWPHKKNPK